MQKQHVVVRFCGDSGDGMQLTGTMFASLSAILGNEISTLPDFPAEIRAPQGTLGGVSGFQVQLGTGVYTPGDQADVIVAMNAAALKVCALGSDFNKAGAQGKEESSMFRILQMLMTMMMFLPEKSISVGFTIAIIYLLPN